MKDVSTDELAELRVSFDSCDSNGANGPRMYLVDTSVWIHALRPAGHPEIRARLKPLILSGDTAITEWILLELMTGLTKSEHPDTLLTYEQLKDQR